MTPHDFFEYLQNGWGTDPTADFPISYSQKLLASSNFWGLLEGTHLLMLMLFFGSILFVDLRLLGLSFRRTPVSVVSDKILPLTVFSMVLVMATGVILFMSKPEDYWHNLWFRSKMILLAIAIINVAVFHKLVQKNQAQWDAGGPTPAGAKISAIISILSWALVIFCGRFIAYNFVECGKPLPDAVNTFAACAASSHGAMSIQDGVDLEAEQAADDAAAAASQPAGLPELPALPEMPADFGTQPEAK